LHNSPAEDFLFYECILHELNILNHGIFISINDGDLNYKNNRTYYVQARLISHVFDTKGAEKALNFSQTSNSKFGSPLVKNPVKGVYFEDLKKTVFCDDFRMYLSLRHKTRLCGQSSKCCPYKDNLVESDYYFYDGVVNLNSCNQLHFESIESLCINNDCNSNEMISRDQKNSYINFIINLRKQFTEKKTINNFYIWYHFQHDLRDIMCEHLYFPHCCYKFKKYEKINNEEFKDKVKNKYGGVKGESLFSNLPYSNIQTDFCWDTMHVFKNLCYHLLEALNGSRLKDKNGYRLHCKKTGCHPSYAQIDTQIWTIKPNLQKKIDLFINCIRIPITYTSIFQSKGIFNPSKTLESNDYLRILSCLLVLIGFIGKLPYPYQEFLSMLQSDINELIRRRFPEDYDYNHLFELVCETIICKIGLFPFSEIYFELPQLIDLPSAIEMIGPLKEFTSYTGERFNKDVKTNVKKVGLMQN
jgi:hypothetical protein